MAGPAGSRTLGSIYAWCPALKSADQVLKKLRSGGDARDEQVITCSRARYVEELALGLPGVFEVGVVTDLVDARLRRDDLLVAGENSHCRNSSPLARSIMPTAT